MDFFDSSRLPILERPDQLQYLSRVFVRDYHDALRISDDDVAGHDYRTATGDGHIDFTRPIFIAATRTHAAAEGGKSESRERFDISNRPVNHQAAKPGR